MHRRLIPVLCLGLCFALAGGVPLIGAVLDAPETGQAAVLFDPRSSLSDRVEAASRANVRLVRAAAAPGALIVELPDAGAAARLRAAGAWLVADPVILGGCALNPALSPPSGVRS